MALQAEFGPYRLAPGSTIGPFPYVIERPLGSGHSGMAELYLATVKKPFRKLQATKQVVIKIAAPAKPGANNRSIRNEEMLLPDLDHAGIVKLLPIWRDDQQNLGRRVRASLPGDPWFCLFEYLEGDSLAEQMQRHTRGLPLAYVVEVVRSLTAALVYLHGQQVVHMDIKPSNILFRQHGRWGVPPREPVLIDFGIARTFGQSSVGGTEAYLAPERRRYADQANEAVYAHPSMDIYALGILWGEMLTGQRISAEPLHPYSSYRRNARERRFIAQELDPLILAALENDWRARPEAATLLSALERVTRPRVFWPLACILAGVVFYFVCANPAISLG